MQVKIIKLFLDVYMLTKPKQKCVMTQSRKENTYTTPLAQNRKEKLTSSTNLPPKEKNLSL
jgi:hypothetical protein